MCKSIIVCVFIQKREDEFQQEMERQRVEKEKEIARLRAQQERAKDKQAEKVCTISFQYSFCVSDLA